MRKDFKPIAMLVISLAVAHEAEGQEMKTTSIGLPAPRFAGKVSVEEAISSRRTAREYKADPLALADLSQLCWAAAGVTDTASGKRAAPSGGALFPIDVYVLAGNVNGLGPGVYRYVPGAHRLDLVRGGEQRQALAAAALRQMWIAGAPVVFVLASEHDRITRKYGARGIRYAHMEAGHIGQNLFLQAEAIGLHAGIVGAFDDGEVARILGLPPKVEPLSIMPVGR